MNALFSAKNLGFSYPGGFGFREVSLEGKPGEVISIFGSNGSGKTTLLRVLATLVPPHEGSLHIGTSDASSGRDLARDRIFPVFDGNSHFDQLTGRENIAFFLALYRLPERNPDPEARAYGLDLDRPAGEYSLGMRRKLTILESFLSGRQILLYDEPGLGLDTAARALFFSQACHAAEAGSCVVFTTNRVEDTVFADRIFRMDSGILAPVRDRGSLIEGTVRVVATFRDREIIEYINSLDDLPATVAAFLHEGIPQKIEVSEGTDEDTGFWSREAREKVNRAPQFLRGMITDLVERHARETGRSRITPEVVDEAKKRFGQ